MTSRIIRSAYGGAREAVRLRAIHEQEAPTSERAIGYTSLSRVELHNLESGGKASEVLNPPLAPCSASSRLRR